MDDNEEYRERPVWRIVLSIAIAIFAVIRLFATCNKMDSRQSNIPDSNILNLTEQRFSNQGSVSSSPPPKAWNSLLYKRYKYLDSLDLTRLRDFYIVKLTKDSLVSLDIKSQLKIEKGCFFQNTHDDSLKFAFKTPKNLNVFVHDFEGTSTVDASFKQLKSGSKIKNYRDFIKLSPNSKLVSYNITQSGIKFKGVAYAFKQDNYKMFIEFESSTLTQINLEHQALTYVSKHIKVVQ
ncbi:hypothetical protein DBR40_03960 [Pedobacter sp. KBW01]|uniref:hypothetical protein n=1 Tax=Pedobacter sp. KBW01 TaxID=2153364 RepID=UPI000F5B2A7C|nr:hypothetical protein [Pedobacter sp. KBW01]RQO78889.1 hypothetical protein DBR40_03960 [Pedobacter sp. KBW01]